MSYHGAKPQHRDIPGQQFLDGETTRAKGRKGKRPEAKTGPVRPVHQVYDKFGQFTGYAYDDGTPVPQDEWPKR